ncbi:MAG: sporulation integral membrane protein YtvI [Lachnospiraceae bacterium]|nr:sporulation integral membrane protein YtvI [Lachnospiraceae bacterium]
MKKYCKAVVNIVVAIVVTLFAVLFLPKILAFFAPFVVGGVIAWLAGPLVNFFEKKVKLKRRAGSAFVIIVVIGLIVLAIYGLASVLIKEGIGLVQSFPELWSQVQQDLNELGTKLEKTYQTLPMAIRENLDGVIVQLKNSATSIIGKLGMPTINAVGNFAMYLPTFIVGMIISLLSAYFFVSDRAEVNAWCSKHVPKACQDWYRLIKQSMLKAVGGYFLAQFKIEIWVYLLLVVGLWILNVKYVLLVALLIAFLDLLPIFGTGTVMVPWALIKFFGGDYRMAVGLLIVWGVGQLVRQIIQPKIVGDSIGISPIPTLFMLYIGFQYGGVAGMIIAIPVGLILYSMYEGGVFEPLIQSIKLLASGINSFRRLTPEDIESIQQEELEEEKILEEKISKNK